MITETVKTDVLSNVVRDVMWKLVCESYEGAKRETFFSDLAAKSHVILLKSRSGDLQGFSTVTVSTHQIDGQKYRAVFSGDTVLRANYRGGGDLARAFGGFIFRTRVATLICEPRTKVYWFLQSKGYKTYLLMANNFSEHFPRYDRATPTQEARILAHYYGHRYGSAFDPGQGLIVSPLSSRMCLKPGVAPIPTAVDRSLKISYFVERNPRWSEGVELACIARVSIWTPVLYLFKYLGKKLRRRKGRQRIFIEEAA